MTCQTCCEHHWAYRPWVRLAEKVCVFCGRRQAMTWEEVQRFEVRLRRETDT